MPPSSFVSEEEFILAQKFKDQGYVICSVTDFKLFEHIQTFMAEVAANYLGYSFDDKETFLNLIHKQIGLDKLNE